MKLFQSHNKCAILTKVSIILMSISGCATVNFNVPNNRFITPENNGKFLSTKISAGYGSKSNVVMAENISSDLVILDKPKTVVTDGSFALAELSLVPALDVFYGPTGPGAKLQFIGAPEKGSKPGNFSMAVAAAREVASNTETTSITMDQSKYEQTGKAKYDFYDMMALMGYRTSSNRLVYLNFAKNFFTASGSIIKTNQTGTLVESATYEIPRRKGRETSILLGLQGGSDSWVWMLEPGYSITEFDSAKTVSRMSLGGILGYRF